MKITKTQLRQIIKEEILNEVNSSKQLQELFGGIKKFLKGRSDQVDPYSTKEQSAIEQLAMRIEQDKEGKYKEATQKMFRKDRVKGEEAISVAIGILGEPGFGQKKSSGGAVGYDASSFSDKDRAEIAGMKRQQRDQRNASRPTYASAKSDEEARNMLRARSGR
jgi:hypothetical protein